MGSFCHAMKWVDDIRMWDIGGIKLTIKNKDKYLPLNLQFFGEEDPPGETLLDDIPPDETPPDDATFTQSELDSQISKSVDSALKKQQVKFEKDKQDALDKAKKDAVEYAKLSKEQQEDADYQKRIKALEDRESDLNNRQLLSEIESDLKENELPTSFAQALLSIQDNEQIKESITDIKKQFDDAVNAKVMESLRQDTPKAGGGRVSTSSTPNIAEMARNARIIK